MAVRNEYVRLSLDDDFTTGMARATAQTALFRRSLGDLDGANVDLDRSLADTAVGVDRVGRSFRDAGPEIDRLSGRLRLFRDAALTLGPALIPLGAATIPVLTGALAGLGAASGAIAAGVLALHGVGDALKALDDFQAAPTAENLQAMRVEMEKLGPAGEHFVRYIDSIESELSTLQIAAREGLFPGLEEGIDSALDRLPGVRKIIRELAMGLGDLTAAAGADLAPGGDWDAFFRYLDTDGQRTLEQFGSGLGDIANGLADMLVAFAPLTRDFTSGFEDMAQSFADWAAGLGKNDSFQEFLAYVRESGPQALDFLGSLVDAFASLAKAAAPLGQTVLPALTALLDVIAAIAASPIGSTMVAAAAGFAAYSRAVDLATASQARFAATSGLKAAGRLGFAALAVGVYEFNSALYESDAIINRWGDQLEAGTFKIAAARDELAAFQDDLDSDSVPEFFKNLFDPDVWADTAANILGVQGPVDELQSELDFLGLGFKQSGGLSDLFGQSVGQTGRQMRLASGDAQEFSASLAELNGWFDKRQAIRDYNESLRTLSKSLRNGFTRQDVINLDDVGRNMLKVAETIKDKSVRAQFLEGAKASLKELAEGGGPKAQRAIEKIIAKMEELGLVRAEPVIDADTKPAERKLQWARREFDIMDALAAEPTLDANANPFYGIFNPANAALDRFDGRVATATLKVTRQYSKALSSGSPGGGGSEVPGTTGQLFGEPPERTSLTFGRGFNDDKAAMFGDLRGGGVVALDGAARSAAWSLATLQGQASKAEKALEKERRQRDAIRDQRNSLASSVTGGLTSDIWAGSENVWGAGAAAANPNAILAADIAKAKEFNDLIATLKARGLDGPALAEVLMSGDLERARLIASMSAADLADYERLYEERAAITGATGQAAGMAVFGAALAREEKQLAQANAHLRDIKQAIKQLDKNGQKGHQDTAESVEWAMRGAVRDGRRRART